MTLRCKMFGHKLSDAPQCRCKRCGTPMHTFEGCRCTRCGLIKHTFPDRNCTCTVCGETVHDYDGCICRRCGETRHEFVGCKCTRCGLTRHDWEELEDDGSFITKRCKLCGETVKEEKVCDHDWELIDSYEDPFAISYCSGHEYVVGDPGPINIYRCKKCGKEEKR